MNITMNMLSLILAIVLNLVPPDVKSFTVEGLREGETIRCTKQAGGDWRVIDEAGQVDRVAFHVDGTKLTVKDDGDKQTMDLADHLGIEKDADWSKIETINIGDGSITIERRPDGLDLAFRPEKNDDAKQKRIRVRWEVDVKPQDP